MRMPGGARGDRLELAADVLRRVGLRIEAVVLGQAAGEEDVDDRLCGMGRGRGRLQRGKVVAAQAEEAGRPRLQSGAARADGMLKPL